MKKVAPRSKLLNSRILKNQNIKFNIVKMALIDSCNRLQLLKSNRTEGFSLEHTSNWKEMKRTVIPCKRPGKGGKVHHERQQTLMEYTCVTIRELY